MSDSPVNMPSRDDEEWCQYWVKKASGNCDASLGDSLCVTPCGSCPALTNLGVTETGGTNTVQRVDNLCHKCSNGTTYR